MWGVVIVENGSDVRWRKMVTAGYEKEEMYVCRSGGRVWLERRHVYSNTYLAANEEASGGGLSAAYLRLPTRLGTMSPASGRAGLVEEGLMTANSDARDPNPAQTSPPLGRTLQSHRRSSRAGRQQKSADYKHTSY